MKDRHTYCAHLEYSFIFASPNRTLEVWRRLAPKSKLCRDLNQTRVFKFKFIHFWCRPLDHKVSSNLVMIDRNHGNAIMHESLISFSFSQENFILMFCVNWIRRVYNVGKLFISSCLSQPLKTNKNKAITNPSEKQLFSAFLSITLTKINHNAITAGLVLSVELFSLLFSASLLGHII